MYTITLPSKFSNLYFHVSFPGVYRAGDLGNVTSAPHPPCQKKRDLSGQQLEIASEFVNINVMVSKSNIM